jgi:NCAIR mutase (PurE)-related protein
MTKKTVDSLIRLVKAGGKLTINANGKSTDSIIRITKAAVATQNKITFTNIDNKSTDSLIRIIKAGGEFVEIHL